MMLTKKLPEYPLNSRTEDKQHSNILKFTHMSKQTAQELPFVLEGNTAKRDTIRSVAKNADGHHKVDLSLIKIRPGFNARRRLPGMSDELYAQCLMIPMLADAIYASNGPAEPILGDFYAPDGCFYVTNGERRTLALRHLVNTGREFYPNGKEVSEVLVLLNPAGTTDLERKRKVIATQDNLKLKPMERAYYYLSFKVDDGLTHDQIAEFLSVSRQTVDNYIKATELPTAVQMQVDLDEVKLSTALAEYREKEKAKKPKKGDPGDEEPFTMKEKEEPKELDGDEDEFEQQDNSIPGTSSMGGFKQEGSGAHAIGKDSIYMMDQKLALWKQALNRLDVVRGDVASNLPSNNAMGEVMTPEEIAIWVEREVATRMMNEYNLTVK